MEVLLDGPAEETLEERKGKWRKEKGGEGKRKEMEQKCTETERTFSDRGKCATP